MIDPRLSIIAAILREPNKPMKFYIEMSEVSRATFFKAKSDLAQRGILRLVGGKQLEVNTEEARSFVATLYPGLVSVFSDDGSGLEAQSGDPKTIEGQTGQNASPSIRAGGGRGAGPSPSNWSV